MSKNILIYSHNHFDPTWRRCFDRPATYHGQVVRSYTEVEEHVIEGWLKLAGQGLTFSEGQTAVWRHYLRRNPKRLKTLQRLARTGTLNIMQAGEVVQDSNMPAAEGLIQNFLQAQPLYRELAQAGHPALKIAWVEDAFGNSANYPQLLRDVGCEVVCCMAYRQLPDQDRVWVGIDGSKIPCADKIPYMFCGCFVKHAPCPACRGNGCDVCRGTGLTFGAGVPTEDVRQALEKAAAHQNDWAVVGILSEEMMPQAGLLDLVKAFNRQHRGKCEARWANPADFVALAMPDLAIEAGAVSAPSADLNPAMPGCLVTRIRCKQRTRAVAYKLVQVQASLASGQWQAGKPAVPPSDLADAWRHVAFNQFHDAITGTLIDSAYTELMDMLDAAETTADRYLPVPPSVPAQPPSFRPVVGTKPRRTRLAGLDITFDRTGIIRILKGKVDLFGEKAQCYKTRRPLRIGELVLDADFGDAWGQRIASFTSPESDCASIALGDYHVACEASPEAIRWHGSYTGGDPKVKKLEWTVTVSPSGDGQRLDFRTCVNWDTGSRRLRAVFPVASHDPVATYEIPFGFLDRQYDAGKLDYSQWKANSMEFPTLHWGLKRLTTKAGVAVLNKGLPCYRWLPGRWDVSLLRSPEWSFCAVEPQAYEFWDIDGQRDTGSHTFEYAVLPFTNGLSTGELTRRGYDYNHATPALPFGISGDVVVTAWKPAESGKGWILRLHEAGGMGTDVDIDFGKLCGVSRANVLECAQEPSRKGRSYRTHVPRHGILTLLIKPGK